MSNIEENTNEQITFSDLDELIEGLTTEQLQEVEDELKTDISPGDLMKWLAKKLREWWFRA